MPQWNNWSLNKIVLILTTDVDCFKYFWFRLP